MNLNYPFTTATLWVCLKMNANRIVHLYVNKTHLFLYAIAWDTFKHFQFFLLGIVVFNWASCTCTIFFENVCPWINLFQDSWFEDYSWVNKISCVVFCMQMQLISLILYFMRNSWFYYRYVRTLRHYKHDILVNSSILNFLG